MADSAEKRGGALKTVASGLKETHQKLAELYRNPGLPTDSEVFYKKDKALSRETSYGKVFVMVTRSSAPSEGGRSERVDLWFVDPRFDDGDPSWTLSDESLARIDQIPDIETNPRLAAALEHMRALVDGEFTPVVNFYDFPRATD